MNPPSPAIVAQNAVRSLPRWIMLLLCAAYVLAGFVGREPWRDVDMAAFEKLIRTGLANMKKKAKENGWPLSGS
jgi:hypothetical protein